MLVRPSVPTARTTSSRQKRLEHKLVETLHRKLTDGAVLCGVVRCADGVFQLLHGKCHLPAARFWSFIRPINGKLYISALHVCILMTLIFFFYKMYCLLSIAHIHYNKKTNTYCHHDNICCPVLTNHNNITKRIYQTMCHHA